MSGMPQLEAQLLEASAEAEGLRDEWRKLAEARGNAFVTPEWGDAWAHAYGGAATSTAVAVTTADQRLVGVMPLVLTDGWPRRLRFAGANSADELEPVCEPGMETDVAQAAIAFLAGRRWALAVFDNVPAAAGWPEALALEGGLKAVSYREATLPVLDLDGVDCWDDYLATRSRNMRSQIRRRERALARSHRLTFRQTSDPGELDTDLATFFRLHYARWAGRGGSTSDSEASRAFHSAFAAAALRRGWLRLWFCELDGQPVASWYGWLVGGCYSYYLAGFDPSWADKGVGGVLLAHTIRDAIEAGATRYELLLGDEAYKQRYASETKQVRTVILARPRHPARALAAAETAMWRLSRRISPARRRQIRERAGGLVEYLPGSRTR